MHTYRYTEIYTLFVCLYSLEYLTYIHTHFIFFQSVWSFFYILSSPLFFTSFRVACVICVKINTLNVCINILWKIAVVQLLSNVSFSLVFFLAAVVVVVVVVSPSVQQLRYLYKCVCLWCVCAWIFLSLYGMSVCVFV